MDLQSRRPLPDAGAPARPDRTANDAGGSGRNRRVRGGIASRRPVVLHRPPRTTSRRYTGPAMPSTAGPAAIMAVTVASSTPAAQAPPARMRRTDVRAVSGTEQHRQAVGGEDRSSTVPGMCETAASACGSCIRRQRHPDQHRTAMHLLQPAWRRRQVPAPAAAPAVALHRLGQRPPLRSPD